MEFNYAQIGGFGPAVRGMRNPLNSWINSDSFFDDDLICLGKNDLGLAQRLIAAGNEHSKFMRFIIAWVDIEAPLYWWKEFDTYKFVEKNSTSTMHKITSRLLKESDFETDMWTTYREESLAYINTLILNYRETKDQELKEELFRRIIQDLPSSYKQTRTIVTNYAELRNMYFQRRNHKLKEWHKFCEWIEGLPYGKELICYEKENENE